MSSSHDFQQALQRLKVEFARQLPSRLQEAQDRLQDCLAAPGNDAAVRELYRVVHKLAGSGGTFGMPDLGERAGALEEILLALLSNPQRTVADFAPVARDLQLLGPPGGGA